MFKKGHNVHRPPLNFPRGGTATERLEWLRDEYLKLFNRTGNVEKKQELLTRVYNLTLKLDKAAAVPEAEADEHQQYSEYLAKRGKVDGKQDT